MKKRIILLFLSLTFLSAYPLLSQSNGFATIDRDTNRIVKTNWTNSMGLSSDGDHCILLEEDNLLLFVIKARFSQADISDYPSMHFWYSYSIPSPAGSIPFYDLTPELTDVHYAGILNGDSIWEVRYTVEIDLAELCGTGIEPFDMEMTYQFVTTVGSTSVMIPYPYSYYPDLFPTAQFIIPPSGHSEELTKVKAVCCFHSRASSLSSTFNEKNNKASLDLKSSQRKDIEVDLNQLKNLTDILVFPNPFVDQYSIEYNIGASNSLELSCFNSTGQLMTQKTIMHEKAGHFSISLNTHTYPPGIYFLKLTISGNNKVVKIWKRE